MTKHFHLALLASLMAVGTASAKSDKTIRLTFKGNTVQVTNQLKDSTEISIEGAHITLNSHYATPITVRLQGQSQDGSLTLKNEGRVKLELNNLQLTSQEGAPLWLKNKKRVEISAPKGTRNSLTIVECQDTAIHKAATIFAKENIKFTGKGQLDVTAEGKGCKGITAKGNITIDDLTLNVTTKGDNWTGNRGKFGGMGGGFGGDRPGGGFRDFPGGDFGDRPEGGFRGIPGGDSGDRPESGFRGIPGGGFGDRPDRHEGDAVPDSLRGRHGGRERGRGGFPGGNFSNSPREGFPGFGGGFPEFGGFGGDFPDFGGFPGFGGSRGGHGNPKGISAAGNLTINSGNITIKTAFHGGEGLESKQTLTINGGNIDIDVVDDAINSARQIVFNGGTIIARSSSNDAVDCNGQQDPITINGGTIYAWSSNGSPEEGIDSDFSPIQLNGGRIFSMGGGMMGDEPSKPNNETSNQPSILLVGLEITEGLLIEIYEGTEDKLGKKIDSFKANINLSRCSSLISYPEFKVGGNYILKYGDKSEAFTLEQNYNTNSKGNGGGGFGGFGGWGGRR